jgi:hypothetical protein
MDDRLGQQHLWRKIEKLKARRNPMMMRPFRKKVTIIGMVIMRVIGHVGK